MPPPKASESKKELPIRICRLYTRFPEKKRLFSLQSRFARRLVGFRRLVH